MKITATSANAKLRDATRKSCLRSSKEEEIHGGGGRLPVEESGKLRHTEKGRDPGRARLLQRRERATRPEPVTATGG